MTDISSAIESAPAGGVSAAPTKALGTLALSVAAVLAVISVVGHLPTYIIPVMMVLTIVGVGLRIQAAIRRASRGR